jgi:hypothetical protein
VIALGRPNTETVFNAEIPNRCPKLRESQPLVCPWAVRFHAPLFNRVGGFLAVSPSHTTERISSYSAVSSRLERGVMGVEAAEPELRKPLQRHGFIGRRTA